MAKNKTEPDPLKDIKDKLQAIENLLILQLIQNGAQADQIEKALQVKNVAPTNIPKSFSVRELQRKEAKQNGGKN